MSEKVNIIKAKTSIANRRNGIKIDRKRVAAYCRVSTDHEDQLNSYRSQVKYYTELINKNPDWMMAGIYADEGITGTQVSKRNEFKKMIEACMLNQVDMIITKSISRFARNTLDTLKYVRMLKEKNIAVFFEDEKINTLSMDGELLLVVLSSVAQQEVENISANVKKGLAMKMSRGDIVGFAGALGYDYDPETKQMTVNEKEAEIVRYIFQRYAEGAGCNTIAKELDGKGIKTSRGSGRWYDSTIHGIITNEKYVGDLLQGKTFTIDPISKRRLDNMGEVDQYYLKDHHEAIISRELFEQVQEILKKRGKSRSNSRLKTDEYRTLYSRKYAFSCMIRCGYCGASLTRRTWHTNSKYNKVIWACITATKTGKANCPESKAISEDALKSAFLESYRLITNDRKDVIEEFLNRTEKALQSSNDEITRLPTLKKKISYLQQKQSKLLDMHLDNEIDHNTYMQKKNEISHKINLLENERNKLCNRENAEKDLKQRLTAMRKTLEEGKNIDTFDRQVFESIVDYVIVGGYDEQGNADPSKVTFVYKTGVSDSQNGKDFKKKRKNAAVSNLQSPSILENKGLQSPYTDDEH